MRSEGKRARERQRKTKDVILSKNPNYSLTKAQPNHASGLTGVFLVGLFVVPINTGNGGETFRVLQRAFFLLWKWESVKRIEISLKSSTSVIQTVSEIFNEVIKIVIEIVIEVNTKIVLEVIVKLVIEVVIEIIFIVIEIAKITIKIIPTVIDIVIA